MSTFYGIFTDDLGAFERARAALGGSAAPTGAAPSAPPPPPAVPTQVPPPPPPATTSAPPPPPAPQPQTAPTGDYGGWTFKHAEGALQKLISMPNKGPAAAYQILQALGVSNVNNLRPDQWPQAYQMAEAAAAQP